MEIIFQIVDEISKEKISEKSDRYSERERLEIEHKSAQIDRTVQESLVIKADRKSRRVYGKKIFLFVKGYIICVLIIFSLYQFVLTPLLLAYPAHPLEIPTSPIITLLGTTSAIVIGLLAAVIRYLFPTHRK